MFTDDETRPSSYSYQRRPWVIKTKVVVLVEVCCFRYKWNWLDEVQLEWEMYLKFNWKVQLICAAANIILIIMEGKDITLTHRITKKGDIIKILNIKFAGAALGWDDAVMSRHSGLSRYICTKFQINHPICVEPFQSEAKGWTDWIVQLALDASC